MGVGTGSSETDLCGQCVICLSDDYAPGDTVRELNFPPTFHSDCFYEWIHKGGKGCPMRCDPPSISVQTPDASEELVCACCSGSIRECREFLTHHRLGAHCSVDLWSCTPASLDLLGFFGRLQDKLGDIAFLASVSLQFVLRALCSC